MVDMERFHSLGYRLLFSGEGDGQQAEDSSDGNWYDDDRIEIRHGYPVRYKCLSALHRRDIHNQESVVDAYLMQLDFEYEMVITNGNSESATENARAIEWSILWNIVQGIGLHRCDFEKQSKALAYMIPSEAGKGHRFRRSQEFSPTNSSSSYILSLATGGDAKTETKGEISCRLSVGVKAPSVCLPMKSSMQVIYMGDQQDMIEKYLLYEIQYFMSTDLVLLEDVSSVTFIKYDSQGKVDTLDASSVTPSKTASLGFLVSVSVGLVAVLMGIFFVGLALRRRSQQHQVPRDLNVEIEDDKKVEWEILSDLRTSDSKDARREIENPKSRDYNEGAWEPLQPELDITENELIMPVQQNSSPTSISSSRRPKRKKIIKRRKNSLRERVATAPSVGIEPILEVDGDSNSSHYNLETAESEDILSSEDEDDDGGPRLFPESPTPLQIL